MKNFLKNTLIVLTVLVAIAGQGLAGEKNTVDRDRVNQIKPLLLEEVELPRTTPRTLIRSLRGNELPPCFWIFCEPTPSLGERIIERGQPINPQQPGELRQPVDLQQPRNLPSR
ncbi:MAG: hypothetical protein AB1589_32670 [Cyanobacteriota bacterium]